jgi:hypothetical protein
MIKEKVTNKKWGIFFIVLLIVISTGNIIYHKYKYAGSPDKLVFKEHQLFRTVVSPHMEQKVTEGTSILYCSSFQLSWNELKNLVNGDIKLSNNPEEAAKLNKSLSTKDDLSEEDYIALAGFKKDNIEGRINTLLKSKFNDVQEVSFNQLSENDIIAYSYMVKNLQFEKEFEALNKPLYFNEGDEKTAVKAFGINEYNDKHYEIGKQVTIFDYNNDNDFIISLKTKSPEDELMLAKVKPQDTLLKTIESVDKRIQGGRIDALFEDDSLVIPKFSFKVNHHFSELEVAKLENPGFSDYLIAEALQDIEFVLDEKGAILKSKATIFLEKSAPRIPKNLIFDEPFLLYMKEKGAAYPYFAMWVDNSELMAK